MTVQPPPYPAADEVLDRARGLFSQAAQLVREGLREDPRGRWIDDQVLTRAAGIAQVAGAGAAVAQAMMVQEDKQTAKEFDQALGPYPTPLGQPPTEISAHLKGNFPCPHGCGYGAPNPYRLSDHLIAVHGLDIQGDPPEEETPVGELRHPFLRQQPASNTYCRWIVSTGRSCNQPPTDPIHQEATDGS